MSEVIPPEQVIDNRFELIEPVDGFGLGTCWKARDRRVRQRAKLVRLLSPLPPGSTALPESHARTLRTLQTLRNPAALEVIHSGLWNHHPFVVHDWFDGLSLDRALAEFPPSTPLPMESARSLVDQVCGALEAALQLDAALTHGALAPTDVLVKNLATRPEVRVVGIGLAALDGRAGADPLCDDIRAVGSLLRALLASPSPDEGPWRDGTPSGVVDWIDHCDHDAGRGRVPTMKALRDGLRSAWSTAPMPAQRPERSVATSPSPTTPSAPPASSPPAAPSPPHLTAQPPIASPVRDVPPNPLPLPTSRPLPSAAPDEGPSHLRDRANDTVMLTTMSSAADDEGDALDMTRRAESPFERNPRPPTPRPPAPALPVESGERTVMLSTLSSPSDGDGDPLEMTRRADPPSARPQPRRSTQPAARTPPVGSGAPAATPSSLSSTYGESEDELDLTTRAPAPSERFHPQPPAAQEVHEETLRLANFSPGMDPWASGDTSSGVTAQIPQQPLPSRSPRSSNAPAPTPVGSPKRTAPMLVVAVVLGVALVAVAALLLTR